MGNIGSLPGSKVRAGVRPSTYQPVGIATEAINACPLAIVRAPGCAGGRGVRRRDTCNAAGRPARKTKPGANPYMTTL